jgi:Flp pilus assembly protein TadG
MVEFAIVSVIFLFLLFGVVEFGRAVWIKNSINAGAREGARYAAVRGSTSGRPATADSVSAYVATKIPVSPLIVSATWPDGNDPGDAVQVRVRYVYRPLISIPFADTLSSVSKMVIVF